MSTGYQIKEQQGLHYLTSCQHSVYL